MFKRIVLLAVVLTLFMASAAGCMSYIKPTDLTIIDGMAGNSAEVADRASTRPDVPPWVKSYLRSNADGWRYFSDVGHWRRPASQPDGG